MEGRFKVSARRAAGWATHVNLHAGNLDVGGINGRSPRDSNNCGTFLPRIPETAFRTERPDILWKHSGAAVRTENNMLVIEDDREYRALGRFVPFYELSFLVNGEQRP
jgi:hypothetical protein